MPTEIRLVALATLVAAAIPALAGGAPPWVLCLVIAALAVAALGLIPPAPPMANGLAAVIAGATLAGLAATVGHVGLVAVVVAPIAVTSLHLGWRPAVWAGALAATVVVLVDSSTFLQPWLAPGLLGCLAVGLLATWAVTHTVLGRLQVEMEPA